MKEKVYKFETLQLHAGQEEPDSATDARAVPIYATTSYVFKDSEQAAQRFALREGGNIYSRLMNPTSDVFEQRMAALENGAAALATASGSAAIDYAIRNIVTCGDHIVSSSTVYGGTYNLFANTLTDSGITTSFVDGSDPKNFEAAIQDNTKAVYLESLGNPNADIIDLEAVSEIAHRHGIPVIVDNTFATPFLFRPLEHGADIVVHSATKFIGGHGTVMGGVIVDGGRFDWAQNDKFPGLSKPNPSYHGVVFTQAVGNIAYIMKIRTTLMREHHPSLAQGREKELYERYYPKGGASIFTFEIKGSEEQARTFTESLSVFSLLANVADVKSLVIHPASTTHSQMSAQELAAVKITPQTVRLSIGTEHIDDILEDLRQGFAAISAGK